MLKSVSQNGGVSGAAWRCRQMRQILRFVWQHPNRGAGLVGAIERLADRKVEVIVIQLGKLDLGSPAGKLKLAMLVAVVEMERDFLNERTQVGLARAKGQGKTLGRRPKTTVAERQGMIEGYMRREPASAHWRGVTAYPGQAFWPVSNQRQLDEKVSFQYVPLRHRVRAPSSPGCPVPPH